MTYQMKADDESGKYAVIIEDDDRTAYAYLLENNQIIADVWLYNRIPTPAKQDWSNPDNMPFVNSQEFVYDDKISVIENNNDVDINWHFKKGILKKVEIFEKKENRVIAILCPNVKPGWSYLAKKRGPLARPLNEFVE
jgi:hypothetical protein